MSASQRRAREGFDLTLRAAVLHRSGAPFVAVLAAVDQAETSLRRERDPMVFRPLLGVCRALTARRPDSVPADPPAVDRALRLAALALGLVGDGAAGADGGPPPPAAGGDA